jgi:hypothetical protein
VEIARTDFAFLCQIEGRLFVACCPGLQNARIGLALSQFAGFGGGSAGVNFDWIIFYYLEANQLGKNRLDWRGTWLLGRGNSTPSTYAFIPLRPIPPE